MRPIIGVSLGKESNKERFCINKEYIEALEGCGGEALLIPPQISVSSMIKKLQGLVLSGGPDLDPLLYGEEPEKGVRRIDPQRDGFEKELLFLSMERNIPILGICRGIQAINVFLGGSLHQEIKTHIKHWQFAPKEHPTHTIIIEKDSLLYRIVKKEEMRVNSFHHQAIKDLGKGLFVSARAKDGVIEAVECKERRILGLQFHAECMWRNLEEVKKIFEWLIMEAKR